VAKFRNNKQLSQLVDSSFGDTPTDVIDGNDVLSNLISDSFDESLPNIARNPFGTFRAPDAIHDPAGERFLRGVKQGLVPMLPIPGEVGARLQEEAQFSAPAAGTAGFLGNVTGSIIPNALMLVFPATAPLVVANFAGSAAGQSFVEDGNVQAAIGAGVIESVTELLGTKLIAKIGVDAAKPLGRAILQKDFKAASKFTLRLLQDSGIEGGEEVTALVLNNFNQVSAGLITPEEALSNIKRDSLITFAGGSIGGAALGVISLATPGARLEFRAVINQHALITERISQLSGSEKNDMIDVASDIVRQRNLQEFSGIQSQTSPAVTKEQADDAEYVMSLLRNESDVQIAQEVAAAQPPEVPTDGPKQDPLLNSVSSRPFEPIVAGINQEITQSLKRRKQLPSGQLSKAPRDSVLKLIYGLEEGSSIDTMAEFLGGSEDSITWHTLFGDIKQGRESSMDGYYNITDLWHQAIKDSGIELGSSRMRLMSPAMAGVNLFQTARQGEKVTKAITQDVTLSGGNTIKMHQSQLMFLAASLQDKQTSRLILSGKTPLIIQGQPSGSEFILTKADLAVIEQSLDPQMRAMVNSFVEIVNGPLRDTYVEYSQRQFGVNKAKKGTYVPRHRSGDQIQAVSAVSSTANQQLAMDRVGINKERIEDPTRPIEIRDMFLEFANLNWTINQLRFVSPTVQSARRVLADPAISRTIRESTRGQRTLRRFTDHYDEIEAGVVGRTIQPRMSADSAFGRLARNVSKGVLGFSPTVPFYQPVSLINASFEMDKRFLMRAWLEQAHFNPAVNERMLKVGAIRFRAEGSTYSLINEGAAIGQQPQALLGVKPKNEVAFSAIRFFDGMAIRTIWRASELQAQSEIKRGLVPEGQEFERASQIATRVINRTQPTNDPLYVSGIALQRRTSGGAAALLTMFRGQTSKTVDMIHREMIRASTSPARRFQSAANIFVLTFGLAFVVSVIREIVRAALRGFAPDPGEDNLTQRLLKETISKAAGILVLGEFINFFARPALELITSEGLGAEDVFGKRNMFDPDFSPATGILEDMVRKSGQLANKIQNDKDAIEILDVATDIAALAGVLFGIPILAPVRESKKIYKQIAKDSGG
jgi:hypothetical protein